MISTVMGRYFKNTPTTPGQNTSVKKAAIVVAVEAMIAVDHSHINIRLIRLTKGAGCW